MKCNFDKYYCIHIIKNRTVSVNPIKHQNNIVHMSESRKEVGPELITAAADFA